MEAIISGPGYGVLHTNWIIPDSEPERFLNSGTNPTAAFVSGQGGRGKSNAKLKIGLLLVFLSGPLNEFPADCPIGSSGDLLNCRRRATDFCSRRGQK